MSKIRLALVHLLTLTGCMMHCGSADAANVYVNKCEIIIVGLIESGDEEKFRALVVRRLKQNACVGLIKVYSPGGDLDVAIAIGRQVRALHARTQAPLIGKVHSQAGPIEGPVEGQRYCNFGPKPAAQEAAEAQAFEQAKGDYERLKKITGEIYRPTFDPGTGEGDPRCECASACFLIWLGGSKRLGDVVRIHRPYYDPQVYQGLSLGAAKEAYQLLEQKTNDYLKEYGVPDSIRAKMFATSSTDAYYLSRTDLGLLRESAYEQELINAKCGAPISDKEIQEAVRWKHENNAGIPDSFPIVGKLKCLGAARKEIEAQAYSEYLSKYDY